MSRVAVILAKGFEEIEAITPIDLLRRAGVEVLVLGLDSLEVKGARGITLKCDNLLKGSDLSDLDGIILPGGMPGAQHLSDSTALVDIIKGFNSKSKLIGAICAAPGLVLGKHGLLENRSFTCYPGFEKYPPESSCYIDNKKALEDGNIITGNGPGGAIEFSLKLIEKLLGPGSHLQVGSGILYL